MSKKLIIIIAVIAVVAIVAVALGVVLLKEEPVKNVEGTLEEIMTKVYVGIPEEELPMALSNMEVNAENIEMFLGTTNIHTYTKTFYIIPEEGKNSIVLGKFSATEGFNAKTGENVKINFTDSSIGNNVNILSKDDIENVTYSNKIFYRSPANVTMQISIGENKFFENRLTINQFGNLILVPINKMKKDASYFVRLFLCFRMEDHLHYQS